jgi:OPT family oligopeptide transporter
LSTHVGRQLTVRATITGMLLGGFMSLSNLYIVLKAGWSFGVTITAGILAFALFSFLQRIRLIKREFGPLENNAMQSVASAAGYMCGGGTMAAVPAFMLITGTVIDPKMLILWVITIAFLGVVVAIPMKRQMINIEKLAFPSGMAAAETIKALHATSHHENGGERKQNKAKLLLWGGAIAGLVALARDFKHEKIPFNLPEKIPLAPESFTLFGFPLSKFTFQFDVGLLMIGAGGLIGIRTAISQLVGSFLAFLVCGPLVYHFGVIQTVSYSAIMKWVVWGGASLMLTSSLTSLAFQWRSIARAFQSLSSAAKTTETQTDHHHHTPEHFAQEVPMNWFLIGFVVLTPVAVWLQWTMFGIAPWMGLISVVLGLFIAVVACRVTGETDTTPSGALGKITQVTFGILDPGVATTNLMAANVTGGMGLHAADLLTDLKSGYILGANPRQQFWAQFFGVVAGSLFVIPAFFLLVPNLAELGTDKWPAPGVISWKSVAEMLGNGVSSLPVSARWAVLAGGLLGIFMVLLEKYKPVVKKFLPSPTGLGLGFTLPFYNSLGMFIGAVITWFYVRKNPSRQEDIVIPVSSGLIAGESLAGVFVAVLTAVGVIAS